MASSEVPLRRRVLYLLIFNVVALAAIAGALELFGRLQLGSRVTDNFVTSWRFNHTWRPNSSWTHREWALTDPSWPIPYTHYYNGEAWVEDYEVEVTKAPGTFRIFYLGDSFVEGAVAMDGSVPSLVEAELNRRGAALRPPLRVEVINTGTASYSPMIHYVLLRYKILAYDPDLVVIAVDMTDDYDDWKYRQTAVYDESGAPAAVPPRPVLSAEFIDTEEGTVAATPLTYLQLFLYQHSSFYRYLNLKLAGVRRNAGKGRAVQIRRDGLYQRWSWVKEDWDPATRENVALTFDTIRRTAELLRSHDVGLLLTAVPHYSQYAGDREGKTPPSYSARPHIEIGKLARELGVPYLNSHAALAEKIRGTAQTQWYYQNDMHFNPRGYRIWADAHLEALLDSGHRLLPEALLDTRH